MRSTFVVVALCLAVANAAMLPASRDYDSLLKDIFAGAKELEQHREQLLQRYYEKVPIAQIQQVDMALESIEARKTESKDCIEAVQQDVFSTLENLFDGKGACQASTHKEAEEIIEDIALVVSEILVDAYELTLLYKECAAETNNVKQGFCYTRFSIKILLCVNELRLTIQNMVQQSNQKFDIVIAEADTCNQRSVDKALLQLQSIHSKIDSCIEKH